MKYTLNHLIDGDDHSSPHSPYYTGDYDYDDTDPYSHEPVMECEGCGHYAHSADMYQTDWGEICCKTCIDGYLIKYPNMSFGEYQEDDEMDF